jgi:hypothetical protein
MSERHRAVPSIALALAVLAAGGAAEAQANQQGSFDFTKAVLAEVKNAAGQVVLSGKFAVANEEEDDVERKAPLAPTTIDPDASGEAEVEFTKSGTPKKQEVEFSVVNVKPGEILTLVIDGQAFATITADAKGRAALEREVPLPTGGGTR